MSSTSGSSLPSPSGPDERFLSHRSQLPCLQANSLKQSIPDNLAGVSDMSSTSNIEPSQCEAAEKESDSQFDILVRGVYETGVFEWRRSRSLLSSKPKWFAIACRQNAFMEGDTGVITIPLTESPDSDEDADNLNAFRRLMHFIDHGDYWEVIDHDDHESFDIQADILPIHAMVYVVADKYELDDLKGLARDSYKRALMRFYSYYELACAIKIIDRCIAPVDDEGGLWQITATSVAKNLERFIQQEVINDALRQAPNFTVTVMERLQGMRLLLRGCSKHDEALPCRQCKATLVAHLKRTFVGMF